MNEQLKKIMAYMETQEFRDSSDRYFQKLAKEKEDTVIYYKDGSFAKDMEKIKNHIEKNDFFDFEHNSYTKEVLFINEKFLLSLIKSEELNLKNTEDDDYQEYEYFYEDLTFHFLHGQGTAISVYKTKN